MLVLLIVLYCGFVVSVKAISLELPPYIERCSLSDPNLNECFKEKANLAIPHLAKGDLRFGIASVSPAVYEVAAAFGNGFNVLLYDTFNDDFKDLKVTKVVFDLKEEKLEFSGALDRCFVSARNYTVVNGSFLGIPATGHGLFNMTLVGITMDFKADLHQYKKLGETYLEVVNYTLTSNTERGYYHFENLRSTKDNADINGYIDKNWKEFRKQLAPAYESYFRAYIYSPISAIFNTVPINKMFSP